MMAQKWVIFDIDGTLANISHRLHYINGVEKKDWDGFNSKMLFDEYKPAIGHIQKLYWNNGFQMAIVTGRFEKYRDMTVQWLKRFSINYNELHMRPDEDYSSDYLVKEAIYEKHFKDRDILFVVDDRQRVVDMWRDKGLICLQCQQGDY